MSEPYDIEEVERILGEAQAFWLEFMPDPEEEKAQLTSEERDAFLNNDEPLFDRTRAEGVRRSEAWARTGWFWHVSKTAQEEHDMTLLHSAATSIRLVSEAEFHRRSNPPGQRRRHSPDRDEDRRRSRTGTTSKARPSRRPRYPVPETSGGSWRILTRGYLRVTQELSYSALNPVP
jgi:hypothetical protein